MAKAASPVRLQKELMDAATLTGKRFHRSAAEQIEYWAEMGRSVSSLLNPDDLAAIAAGVTKLKLEPVCVEPVDPAEVFRSLEEERVSGALVHQVTGNSVKYQASLAHPGCLERIDQGGGIKTGRFINGEFVAISDDLS